MWGKRNCLSLETAVGGIEPPSIDSPAFYRATIICAYLSVFVWMIGSDSHVDVPQVDNILRKLQEELLTQIVRVDHIRRNEYYWAGDHPRELAFRRTTYAQVGTFVQVDILRYTIVHTLVCSFG